MLPDRFWKKVHKTKTCWLWTASRIGGGYGSFGLNGTKYAHRLVYEDLVGPIPAGLDIDHLCRVRHCVNPDHLEPVTRAENLRRGKMDRHSDRTHCKRGHAFDEENTYTTARGHRGCRACAREHQTRYYHQRNPDASYRGPYRQVSAG